MHVAPRIIINEGLCALFPESNKIFIVPKSINESEKKTLIACTAIINSFAFLSIYEYQFHILGQKSAIFQIRLKHNFQV